MNIPNAKTDVWFGFKRHIFQFEGHEAWIVEPEKALPGMPWTWCMEWPTAFVKRTGVPELLARGFHHVHIHAGHFGNDEDQLLFRRFHAYLNSLGFAAKAHLIGMSFGGLYSFRYAAANPEKVACIYADAPVCSFRNFQCLDLVVKPYGLRTERDYDEHPGLPVNLAEKLARIPLLLLYGGQDQTVPAADNAEVLLARLAAVGGHPEVVKRPCYGHHPHGLDEPEQIVTFMLAHQ